MLQFSSKKVLEAMGANLVPNCNYLEQIHLFLRLHGNRGGQPFDPRAGVKFALPLTPNDLS